MLDFEEIRHFVRDCGAGGHVCHVCSLLLTCVVLVQDIYSAIGSAIGMCSFGRRNLVHCVVWNE